MSAAFRGQQAGLEEPLKRASTDEGSSSDDPAITAAVRSRALLMLAASPRQSFLTHAAPWVSPLRVRLCALRQNKGTVCTAWTSSL